MRWIRVAAGVLASAWIASGTAHSHPMGNISISHYAGIEISPERVRVKYLLDFAEIPSVRELERVDPDFDDRVTPAEREAYLEERTREILARLKLEVNGETLPLEAEWSHVTFPAGEGGLSTVRIAWELRAPLAGLNEKNFLLWNDSNHEDRSGWKEIRIKGEDGIGIGKTSLRPVATSGELSAYPEEYLYDPPTDTKAWCLFGEGMTPSASVGFEPPPLENHESESDPLVRLVSSERLGPGAITISLLLAALLGAGHALEPGHGKTVVAAYLVGSKGTIGQAALLGLTVTITHTATVFLLGAAVLFLSQYFVPESLMPWLGFVSGLLIVVVGVVMLRARWRESHAHDPAHSHSHSHAPTQKASLGSILALGISGGLVPCPAGIVVLLAAASLGRTAFGMLLIVAFGIGLAAVLFAVGALFVSARSVFDRLPIGRGIARKVGLVSASIVTIFGFVLAVRSLVQTSFFST